jgi:hypothetical protein
MALQESLSAAFTDENWNQSIQALISPDTNSSLKTRGDSKTLTRPLPVASMAVPQLPQYPLPT